MASPHFKPAFSELTIQRAVRRLARQIDRRVKVARVADLTVVCVMDGAFIFCADLVRALRTPARLVFLKAQSYQGARKGATSTAALPPGLRAALRHSLVLVVDTIYDTGLTIAKVVRKVRSRTNPVWLAVLVEKEGQAVIPANQQCDELFVGLQVSGDPFLIGYGLDVNGEFRNLPDIRRHDHNYEPEKASGHRRGIRPRNR